MSRHVACTHPDVDLSSTLAYTPAQLEIAATMCHALSDPARLRLLAWLSKREMCVSELVALEHAKTSSISARLQTLYSARLVNRRREAKHIYYTLADNHVRVLLRNILGHAAEAVADSTTTVPSPGA